MESVLVIFTIGGLLVFMGIVGFMLIRTKEGKVRHVAPALVYLTGIIFTLAGTVLVLFIP